MGLYYIEKNRNQSVLAVWEEQEGASRKDKRERERRSVYALLRIVFGADCVLDHRPNGQPFLPHLPLHISIAHTHRFTAVLTHPQKRVGVDVECLDRDFSAVEQRALSDREISFLSPSRELRSVQLAILWSAKEAIFKCVSQEEVDFAVQIQVDSFAPQASGRLNARFFHKNGMASPFSLKYKIIDNHILVCVFADC